MTTGKFYKSAQGKMVDLGTIRLRNEHVRAVGNMKVNARGDKLDSLNQVIETRTESIQRHNERTSTNVSSAPPQSSVKKSQTETAQAPKAQKVAKAPKQPSIDTATFDAPAPSAPAPVSRQATPPAPAPQSTPAPAPQVNTARPVEVDLKNPTRPEKSPASTSPKPDVNSGGGLASAIARSREIKQELDRTRRQTAQDRGLRKI